MSKRILQINARSNVSAEELAKDFMEVATPISTVPGLEWKIFGMSEERSEAAGIYLFENAESLEAYLEGPIITAMRSKPAFGDISVKVFDVAEAATLVTRGPV